jgi:hypothetical protein
VRLPCRLPCSGEQPLVLLVPWRPWPASSWGPVALVELEWDHWLAVLDRVLDLEVRAIARGGGLLAVVVESKRHHHVHLRER